MSVCLNQLAIYTAEAAVDLYNVSSPLSLSLVFSKASWSPWLSAILFLIVLCFVQLAKYLISPDINEKESFTLSSD